MPLNEPREIPKLIKVLSQEQPPLIPSEFSEKNTRKFCEDLLEYIRRLVTRFTPENVCKACEEFNNGQWLQVHSCVDGSLVNLWFPVADRSRLRTDTFLFEGQCYFIASTTLPSAAGDQRVTIADVEPIANCAACTGPAGAIYYTLCADQDPGAEPVDLYYAFDNDPGGDFIIVNDLCYERIGTVETATFVGDLPTDISATDCANCLTLIGVQSIQYSLCPGQTGAATINYSFANDPMDEFIKVDSLCYQRIGISLASIDTTTTPAGSYMDCQSCLESVPVPCSLPAGNPPAGYSATYTIALSGVDLMGDPISRVVTWDSLLGIWHDEASDTGDLGTNSLAIDATGDPNCVWDVRLSGHSGLFDPWRGSKAYGTSPVSISGGYTQYFGGTVRSGTVS